MGKWLNKILKPTDSTESKNHADLEDLARLVEGTLDSAKRKRLIRHLNRCGQCYEIQHSRMYLPRLPANRPPLPGGNGNPFMLWQPQL